METMELFTNCAAWNETGETQTTAPTQTTTRHKAPAARGKITRWQDAGRTMMANKDWYTSFREKLEADENAMPSGINWKKLEEKAQNPANVRKLAFFIARVGRPPKYEGHVMVLYKRDARELNRWARDEAEGKDTSEHVTNMIASFQPDEEQERMLAELAEHTQSAEEAKTLARLWICRRNPMQISFGLKGGIMAKTIECSAANPETVGKILESIAESKKASTAKKRPVAFYQNGNKPGIWAVYGKALICLDRRGTNREEIRQIIRENRAELEERYKAIKNAPDCEMCEHSHSRKGIDWRKGDNYSTEDLMQKTGLSGITFGNWLTTPERQAFVNSCYDALQDLATWCGCSVDVVTIGRKLGIQFGASGRTRANAHYRPADMSINMTKERGAGSLAHEIWHAIDNALQGGNEFASDTDTFGGIMTALKKELADVRKRSLLFEKTTNKKEPYWSTWHEITARAFQRLIADEVDNEFLSTAGSKEEFDKADIFRRTNDRSRCPLVTSEEAQACKTYFHALIMALAGKVARKEENAA